jgi:transposase InsO family protein
MQGSLSIERMCQLAAVSRAGFYLSLQEQSEVEEDMEVRSEIQKIVVEHRRRYGYRRVTAELRRRGMRVNRKRVARIMSGGQPAGNPTPSIRGDDRLRSQAGGVLEFGQSHEADRDQSVVGG